jgi:hypothetical protein
MSSSQRVSKIDALRVAGRVAPKIRRGEGALRVVRLVDSKGVVVRTASLDDVRAGLVRRVGVELDTQTGVRAERMVCTYCGSVFTPSKGAANPRRCGACKCSCGEPLSLSSISRALRLRRRAICETCQQDKGRPVHVDGVEYASTRAAAKALGVAVATLKRRVAKYGNVLTAEQLRANKRGHHTKKRPVVVDGVAYESIAAAVVGTGRSKKYVLARVNKTDKEPRRRKQR